MECYSGVGMSNYITLYQLKTRTGRKIIFWQQIMMYQLKLELHSFQKKMLNVQWEGVENTLRGEALTSPKIPRVNEKALTPPKNLQNGLYPL